MQHVHLVVLFLATWPTFTLLCSVLVSTNLQKIFLVMQMLSDYCDFFLEKRFLLQHKLVDFFPFVQKVIFSKYIQGQAQVSTEWSCHAVNASWNHLNSAQSQILTNTPIQHATSDWFIPPAGTHWHRCHLLNTYELWHESSVSSGRARTRLDTH